MGRKSSILLDGMLGTRITRNGFMLPLNLGPVHLEIEFLLPGCGGGLCRRSRTEKQHKAKRPYVKHCNEYTYWSHYVYPNNPNLHHSGSAAVFSRQIFREKTADSLHHAGSSLDGPYQNNGHQNYSPFKCFAGCCFRTMLSKNLSSPFNFFLIANMGGGASKNRVFWQEHIFHMAFKYYKNQSDQVETLDSRVKSCTWNMFLFHFEVAEFYKFWICLNKDMVFRKTWKTRKAIHQMNTQRGPKWSACHLDTCRDEGREEVRWNAEALFFFGAR